MSHYAMNYGDAWASLRKDVKAARASYLKKMERLKPYADSKQGQEDMEAAKAEYAAALESARGAARPKFQHAIKGMKGRISAADMTPPTAEQLATLQMLELRDEIDAREIEAAAKVMGNNDAALKTLRDILTRKGRIMPTSVKTFEAQTSDAVAELERAANYLLAWDGRTAMEISGDASRAYHEFRWGSGKPTTGHERDTQGVADIEARPYYIDTCIAAAGGNVSSDVIKALE